MKGKTKYRGVRIRGESIQVDFRYKNIRCRETMNMKPNATNLLTASSLLGTIRLDIALNKFNYGDYFPSSKKVDVFGGHTISNKKVSEAIDLWMENNAPVDSSTKKNYINVIELHIKPSIGLIILNELTAQQVKTWINPVDLSASTKNNILTPLRMLFVDAYADGDVDENIMERVKSFKRDKPKKNPLNTHDVTKLLNYLSIVEVEAYFSFAIWTGLSTGEQLGLKWGDINLDKYIASINRIYTCGQEKSTKNNYRERNIELLSPAHLALMSIIPNDYYESPEKYTNEFIFISPLTKKVWTTEAIGLHWKKALKALKIKHRSPYETRHTFASIMVTACLPDGWVRQQMGHATMDMLSKVYAKWLGDADEAIEWLLIQTQDGNNGAQFNKLFLGLHKQDE